MREVYRFSRKGASATFLAEGDRRVFMELMVAKGRILTYGCQPLIDGAGQIFGNYFRAFATNREVEMNKAALILAVALCGLIPAGVHAGETGGLDEMVFTGSRESAPLRESIAPVDTIPGSVVDAVRYRKPEELFNRVSGVNTSSFSGEDAITSVRLPPASGNQETVILVDGLPSFTYGRGSGDFWKYFNSMDVERVEVLKGPASSLYGNGAVGGVINVISKAPPAKQEFGVWGEYGRNDRWRAGASGGARVGQFAGGLNLNFDYSDGWREHSRVEKQDATGNVQYFLDDASVLRLRVDFVHAHNNLPGMLDGPIFFTNPTQSNNTFAYDRIDRITPTLTYDRKIGDYGKLNLAFQVQSNTSDNFIDPKNFMYVSTATPARLYQGIISYQSSLDIDVQARYTHELKPFRSRITGGLDYTHSDQQSDSTNIVLGTNSLMQFTNKNGGSKYDSYDVSVDAIAPYLQAEASPVENLRVLVGGRFDAIWYDATGKNSTSKGGNADFNQFTFRTGATYEVIKAVNLFANYTQGFLAPNAEQLFTAPSYVTTTTSTLQSSANQNLTVEKSSGCEVGVRTNFWENRARFDVSYYDMTVKDKIVRNLSYVDPTAVYQNNAKTRNRGVEVQTTLLPLDMVRARLAYTYAHNQYDNFFGTGGSMVPRAPENHINARVALLPLKGLEVELEVDEVTKQYADDANTLAYSRPTLVNLRASYAWQNWSFWAHALNLTNQNYATYVAQSSTAATATPTASYYPGDPMTFYVGVAYKWN